MNMDDFSLGGERVSSRTPMHPAPVFKSLSDAERAIAAAIPFYPGVTTVQKIMKETGLDGTTVIHALHSAAVGNQSLICSDEHGFSRLKKDLSNVD